MTTPDAFKAWLNAYGDAWERRDGAAFAALFSTDAAYHWTPFDAPQRGPGEIRAAFDSAVANQRDPAFAADVITFDPSAAEGWATWSCALTRAASGAPVRIDGVLKARFGADGACTEFREWWHSEEPSAVDQMRAVDA